MDIKMFKKTKWYLYYLIDKMLKDEIDADFFCSEIYLYYAKDSEILKLTDKESQAFSKIETVTSRFSSSELDHKNHPGIFYTKAQLLDTVKLAAAVLGINSLS
jgi:hypothetical protein